MLLNSVFVIDVVIRKTSQHSRSPTSAEFLHYPQVVLVLQRLHICPRPTHDLLAHGEYDDLSLGTSL